MARHRKTVRAYVETEVDVELSAINTDDLVDELLSRLACADLAPYAEAKFVNLLTERGFEVTKPSHLNLSTAARLRDPAEYRNWLAEQRRLGVVAPPRTGAA